MPKGVISEAARRRIATRAAGKSALRELPLEPARRLWATVLTEAAADGEIASWAAGGDDGCGCGGECFERVCALAGVEPGAVRRRAVQVSEDGWSRRRGPRQVR